MSSYLSIIVPLCNEAESVAKVLEQILEVGKGFNFPYEIVFVDDGSDDNTWQVVEDLKKKTPGLRAIKLRGNYGQTSAMVAGFDHAIGETIVTMDGDLQSDPFDIPKLVSRLHEGYDIVCGWRMNRKDSFLRVLLSRFANVIISFTTGVHLHDYGCSLKAFRAECIKSLKAYGEMHRFFPALASMTGAKVTELPVNHHPREYGFSKYGFDRILKVFSDIFAINMIIRFSSNPLRGFAFCAVPFLFLTLFFGVLTAMALILQWTAGKAQFFLLSSGLTGMAVVHLITLGILGELILDTSDLAHTELPEITKQTVHANEKHENSRQTLQHLPISVAKLSTRVRRNSTACHIRNTED